MYSLNLACLRELCCGCMGSWECMSEDWGSKGGNKWGRRAVAEEWKMEGQYASGGGRSEGGLGVIRRKRLWSVTFKRWATPQGTSARTHTHWNAHMKTTVSSYLLMSRQADRRREEVNGRVGREWNKYLLLRRRLLSLWRKLCTQATVKTPRYFWMTNTNTQTIIILLLYSLRYLFIPRTPPPSASSWVFYIPSLKTAVFPHLEKPNMQLGLSP